MRGGGGGGPLEKSSSPSVDPVTKPVAEHCKIEMSNPVITKNVVLVDNVSLLENNMTVAMQASVAGYLPSDSFIYLFNLTI